MDNLADKLQRVINDQYFCFNYEEMKIVHKALKTLAEYENAEKQGLILRLPCKVGDIVYEIINEGISCPMLIIPTTFTLEDLPLFERKRMFLTKEEAEQALAEMKEV